MTRPAPLEMRCAQRLKKDEIVRHIIRCDALRSRKPPVYSAQQSAAARQRIEEILTDAWRSYSALFGVEVPKPSLQIIEDMNLYWQADTNTIHTMIMADQMPDTVAHETANPFLFHVLGPSHTQQMQSPESYPVALTYCAALASWYKQDQQPNGGDRGLGARLRVQLGSVWRQERRAAPLTPLSFQWGHQCRHYRLRPIQSRNRTTCRRRNWRKLPSTKQPSASEQTQQSMCGSTRYPPSERSSHSRQWPRPQSPLPIAKVNRNQRLSAARGPW